MGAEGSTFYNVTDDPTVVGADLDMGVLYELYDNPDTRDFAVSIYNVLDKGLSELTAISNKIQEAELKGLDNQVANMTKLYNTVVDNLEMEQLGGQWDISSMQKIFVEFGDKMPFLYDESYSDQENSAMRVKDIQYFPEHYATTLQNDITVYNDELGVLYDILDEAELSDNFWPMLYLGEVEYNATVDDHFNKKNIRRELGDALWETEAKKVKLKYVHSDMNRLGFDSALGMFDEDWNNWNAVHSDIQEEFGWSTTSEFGFDDIRANEANQPLLNALGEPFGVNIKDDFRYRYNKSGLIPPDIGIVNDFFPNKEFTITNFTFDNEGNLVRENESRIQTSDIKLAVSVKGNVNDMFVLPNFIGGDVEENKSFYASGYTGWETGIKPGNSLYYSFRAGDAHKNRLTRLMNPYGIIGKGISLPPTWEEGFLAGDALSIGNWQLGDDAHPYNFLPTDYNMRNLDWAITVLKASPKSLNIDANTMDIIMHQYELVKESYLNARTNAFKLDRYVTMYDKEKKTSDTGISVETPYSQSNEYLSDVFPWSTERILEGGQQVTSIPYYTEAEHIERAGFYKSHIPENYDWTGLLESAGVVEYRGPRFLERHEGMVAGNYTGEDYKSSMLENIKSGNLEAKKHQNYWKGSGRVGAPFTGMTLNPSDWSKLQSNFNAHAGKFTIKEVVDPPSLPDVTLEDLDSYPNIFQPEVWEDYRFKLEEDLKQKEKIRQQNIIEI